MRNGTCGERTLKPARYRVGGGAEIPPDGVVGWWGGGVVPWLGDRHRTGSERDAVGEAGCGRHSVTDREESMLKRKRGPNLTT